MWIHVRKMWRDSGIRIDAYDCEHIIDFNNGLKGWVIPNLKP